MGDRKRSARQNKFRDTQVERTTGKKSIAVGTDEPSLSDSDSKSREKSAETKHRETRKGSGSESENKGTFRMKSKP